MPIVICYQDQREIIQDIDPDLAKQLFEHIKNDPKNASHADQMKSTLITTEIEGKMVKAQEFKFPTKDSRDLFLKAVNLNNEAQINKYSYGGCDKTDDEVSKYGFIVSYNRQHIVVDEFDSKKAKKIFDQMKALPNSAEIQSEMQSKLIRNPYSGHRTQQFDFPTEDSRDSFLELVNRQKSIEATTAMTKQLNELKSSETTDSETPVHRIK